MARKRQFLDQVKDASMDLIVNFGQENRFKMSEFLRHGQHLGGVQSGATRKDRKAVA